MKTIGFIGCGNMGQAILTGILAKKLVTPDHVVVTDVIPASREKVAEKFGATALAGNREVVERADLIFLAIKPPVYPAVIGEIADLAQDEKIFISMAPGKTLAWLEGLFARPVKIVRIMPNTPALVGSGMTAMVPGSRISADEKEEVRTVLNSFGETEEVSEHLMDVVTSVSGSSPAYVYMFIEAMADAAVADGMPRAQAYHFAAQAVLGSARMVLETGLHPGELKDRVCSPGGTTIEAVRVLEAKGFRSAVFEAMKACTEKSKNM